MCWPSTNDDLRYRASDSTCDTIAVEETNLIDLAGLEQLERPANLFIARNPNLVDVSQAKKVDGLVKLSDNEALKHAKFGTINRLFIIDQSDSEFPDHHLETLSFTPPEPGHFMQLLIRQNGASGSKLKTIQPVLFTA